MISHLNIGIPWLYTWYDLVLLSSICPGKRILQYSSYFQSNQSGPRDGTLRRSIIRTYEENSRVNQIQRLPPEVDLPEFDPHREG